MNRASHRPPHGRARQTAARVAVPSPLTVASHFASQQAVQYDPAADERARTEAEQPTPSDPQLQPGFRPAFTPRATLRPHGRARVDDQPGFTSGTVSDAIPVTHGGRTYKVRTGDTLLSIAKRHGVSAPAIVELNDLRGRSTVRPGQILSLPAKNIHQQRTAGHRVSAGETLEAIAERYQISVPALQAANAMGTSTVIREGELLSLSGSGATSSRARCSVPEAELPQLPAGHQGTPYPAEVLAAARHNKWLLQQRPALSRNDITAMVRGIADYLGVDEDLAAALAQQESGMRQQVVSPVNAIGVMQVTPRAGAWAAELLSEPIDVLDTAQNIRAGLAILRWLLAHTDSEAEALAGYYQGLASVSAHGAHSDTRRFVHNVQVTAARFRRQENPL